MFRGSEFSSYQMHSTGRGNGCVPFTGNEVSSCRDCPEYPPNQKEYRYSLDPVAESGWDAELCMSDPRCPLHVPHQNLYSADQRNTWTHVEAPEYQICPICKQKYYKRDDEKPCRFLARNTCGNRKCISEKRKRGAALSDDQIRAVLESDQTSTELGREYGVSPSTIRAYRMRYKNGGLKTC
jgi:hypothetical protein